MSDGEFQVGVEETMFDVQKVIAGVPQGSCMSPLLFLLFVNDFPKIKRTDIALYADDTAIIASARRPLPVNEKLQNHLDVVVNYLHKWKLKLNRHKTDIMNFN